VAVDIPDVVTYTNFGDYRLRVFLVAGGQISPSHIDFHRRPYNTLALPCERVSTSPSHARTVVESQWERGKFDSPPPKNPLSDGHQNFVQIGLGVSVLRMRDFAPLGAKSDSATFFGT